METGARAAGEKKMIRFRYIYRHICSVIMILVAVSMFLYAWLDYVFGHSHTGHLIGRGSIILSSILYMILFAVIGNFLHIFRKLVPAGQREHKVLRLILVIADCHIYDRHIPIVQEMLTRKEFPAPKVYLNKDKKSFYDFTIDDLIIESYETNEQIKNIPVAI